MDYREWLEKAVEFLEEARDDVGRGRYWLACFHAQQAAELYLKGVLVRLVGSYPFTHSLVELLDALRDAGAQVDDRLVTVAEALEQHYTRARYPGAGRSRYNREAAERCLGYAEEIIAFARRLLREEEKEA